MVDERRRFTRVNFDTGITITQDKAVYHTYLIDISINGLLVETPPDYALKADRPVLTSILLGDDVEIQMEVVLVHSSSKLLGFRCENIDVESMGHLRRLLELNIDDPDASDRVLCELLATQHDLELNEQARG